MQSIGEILLTNQPEPGGLKEAAEAEARAEAGAVTTHGRYRNPSEDLCPTCHGTETIYVDRGNWRYCECLNRRRLKEKLAVIPPRFGVPRLEDITPRPDRHPKQGEKIKSLRARPDDSYLLCGSNGAGKTFLGYALYVSAAERGRSVAAYNLEQWVGESRAHEVGGGRQPLLTADRLRRASSKWTIFLDEINATKPTEYATTKFFSLLSAAYEYEHQLILTCNVSHAELHEYWCASSAPVGNSIARRIAEHCRRVDMFRG